jgi:hypothetical protein
MVSHSYDAKGSPCFDSSQGRLLFQLRCDTGLQSADEIPTCMRDRPLWHAITHHDSRGDSTCLTDDYNGWNTHTVWLIWILLLLFLLLVVLQTTSWEPSSPTCMVLRYIILHLQPDRQKDKLWRKGWIHLVAGTHGNKLFLLCKPRGTHMGWAVSVYPWC